VSHFKSIHAVVIETLSKPKISQYACSKGGVFVQYGLFSDTARIPDPISITQESVPSAQ